jgi:two-component system response regulator TctD
LIRRSPRLVAKRFLLEALAERNVDLGDSAVDVYISRLRRKIAGSGAAIVTVRGFGYRLEAQGAGEAAARDPE